MLKLGERINHAKSRGGVCYVTGGCLGLMVSYNFGLARFTGLACMVYALFPHKIRVVLGGLVYLSRSQL